MPNAALVYLVPASPECSGTSYQQMHKGLDEEFNRTDVPSLSHVQELELPNELLSQ